MLKSVKFKAENLAFKSSLLSVLSNVFKHLESQRCKGIDTSDSLIVEEIFHA